MNAIATAPVATQSKAYGQIAAACGVGVAAGAYTAFSVAKQAVLLAARTATFAAREAIKTHAPAVAIDAQIAMTVADTSMQAALLGNSAVDAARAQHAACKELMTAEDAAIVARALHFEW